MLFRWINEIITEKPKLARGNNDKDEAKNLSDCEIKMINWDNDPKIDQKADMKKDKAVTVFNDDG